jgi:magnesium transporter
MAAISVATNESINFPEFYGDLAAASASMQATARVPVVTPQTTVAVAQKLLSSENFDSISHIVVCDGERFAGMLTIEALFSATPETIAATLMDSEAPVVAPGVDQEVAALRAVRHRESALAVVDDQQRFIGVIPPYRLLEVLLEEHEEDLSRLGGFMKSTLAARRSSEETVERRFVHRVPWLMVGLLGALFAAELVHQFETQLQTMVMLAFFIPGIVYLADAVGTQTEMVVVRGLSVGVPISHMARREALAGIAIGIALGLLATPLIWWRWGDIELAATVGLAIFGASSTASAAAMLLPWLFNCFGYDPAFGSGPLATVIQDLLSIAIYFGVSLLVIGQLG